MNNILQFKPKEKKDKNDALDALSSISSVNLSEFYNKYPVPIYHIARKLGFDVRNDGGMEDNLAGTIETVNGKHVIKVNSNWAVSSNLITIAELVFAFFNKNTQEDFKRKQALVFVLDLLMPEDKFIEIYYKSENPEEELESTFMMSEDSIKHRAVNLGLIPLQ